MSMAKTKVLIPTGYGLNCEKETAFAFRSQGADATIVHVNDLLAEPRMLRSYQILVLIGGFSDGDHLGAGKVHAIRLTMGIGRGLEEFIANGNLVLGVCNGFQALVKAGILPRTDGRRIQTVTLTYNDSGKFEDRWVYVAENPASNCVWVKGIGMVRLPVRHGEGNFTANDVVLRQLEQNGQIALFYVDPQTRMPTQKYPDNPNGSLGGIAGVSNREGNVLGLMPHPEATTSERNHPDYHRLRRKADADALERLRAGMPLIANGIRHADENLLRR